MENDNGVYSICMTAAIIEYTVSEQMMKLHTARGDVTHFRERKLWSIYSAGISYVYTTGY